MLFRCYQLLQTPAERLARHLNVEIPHKPSVCIDLISADAVVIHWDIETQPEENIFYVILLNGKEAATLSQTSAKLCSLRSDNLYRIQVLAVNAISNFRSQSPALYVRTSATNKSKTRPFSRTRELSLLRSFSGASTTNYSLDLSADDVSNLDDENVLSEYLSVFQNELRRLRKDVELFTENNRTEMARLRAEHETYKKELNEETECKVKKDTDVKGLEKRKDSLTFDKLKLAKQLKNHHSHQNMHTSRLAELKVKVGKLQEKKQHVGKNASSERARAQQKMSVTHSELAHIKKEIAELEESARALTSERREVAHIASTLRPLVEQLTLPVLESSPSNSTTSLALECFTRDGQITKSGSEAIRKVLLVRPDWEGDVLPEMELFLRAESTWKSAFRASIRRFLAVQNSMETARANSYEGYQPQKMSEYQASVEFGGFSNAISKTKKKMYDGSASPSPPPDDDWYGHYSSVYDDSGLAFGLANGLFVDRSVQLEPTRSLAESNRSLNMDSRSILESRNADSRGYPMETSRSLNMDHIRISSDDSRNDLLMNSAMMDSNIYNMSLAQPVAQVPLLQSLISNAQLNQLGLQSQSSLHQSLPEMQYLQLSLQLNLEQNLQQQRINAYQQAQLNLQQQNLQLSQASFQTNQFQNNLLLQGYQSNLLQSQIQSFNLQLQEYPEFKELTDYTKYPEYTGYQPEYQENIVADQFRPNLDTPLDQQDPVRTGFPYDDKAYDLSSPSAEKSFLYPQSMWQTPSYLRGFTLPQSVKVDLAPSVQQLPVPSLSNLGAQNSMNEAFNGYLFPSNTLQVSSTSIWLDRAMVNLQSHNRTVSGGSQLWNASPNPMVSGFLPFAPLLRDKTSGTGRRADELSDMRLL